MQESSFLPEVPMVCLGCRIRTVHLMLLKHLNDVCVLTVGAAAPPQTSTLSRPPYSVLERPRTGLNQFAFGGNHNQQFWKCWNEYMWGRRMYIFEESGEILDLGAISTHIHMLPIHILEWISCFNGILWTVPVNYGMGKGSNMQLNMMSTWIYCMVPIYVIKYWFIKEHYKRLPRFPTYV